MKKKKKDSVNLVLKDICILTQVPSFGGLSLPGDHEDTFLFNSVLNIFPLLALLHLLHFCSRLQPYVWGSQI
jgi:hypothetical protein